VTHAHRNAYKFPSAEGVVECLNVARDARGPKKFPAHWEFPPGATMKITRFCSWQGFVRLAALVLCAGLTPARQLADAEETLHKPTITRCKSNPIIRPK